jgi:hypothetical protein
MVADHEQFDEADDERLAHLLASLVDAPSIRDEFRQALLQRLDAEFVEYANVAGRKSLSPPSTNGTSSGAAHSALTSSAAETKVPANVAASTVRRRRRWPVAIATAASLLLAVVLISDPPAVAAVFRAIISTIEELTIGSGSRASADADANGPGVSTAPIDQSVAIVRETPTPPAPIEIKPQLPPRIATASPRAKSAEPPEKDATSPIRTQADWSPFDKPLAEDELSQRIDSEFAILWQKNGINPADAATDAEFMRRLYLDLTGRIPDVREVQEFLDDSSPNRRAQLVDRLLTQRDHATHLAGVWRGILLPESIDLSRFGGTTKFEEWLADRFAENVPYDQIVRELLLAEGRVSESGPLLFYAALKLNPEELAARTSRVFLGVRMDCAQCHDHPFDKVSQHDFWSFAAFFARISRPRGKMEMTSPVLQVRDNERGEVMIPQSDEVVPPRLPNAVASLEDKSDGPARRKQLVDWLTSRQNGQFARAAVNRVWANLFGRGLVEPADDMRPANEPIAPAVLDTLSRDFAASGFDLRRLMRAIVLSKTYQLSSRSADSDPSRMLFFAQMNIKSFTAEQLYDCIAVATRQAATPDDRSRVAGLERFGDISRQAFIAQFRAPDGKATDYHGGIPQALTLMHGALIHNATDMVSSGLLKSLSAPFFTDEQRLDTLFLSTLSRHPETAERDVMLNSIRTARSEAERQQALGDVLWALLNSAEFTFNH